MTLNAGFGGVSGYGALAQRGEMTHQEKQQQIADFENGQEEKRRSLSKADRMKYEKMQSVLKDEMSRITDDSAITVHGLNSELKMIRKQLLAM